MTIHDITYNDKFSKVRQGVPLHEIDILIGFVLKKPIEFVFTHPEFEISNQKITQLKKLIHQRRKGRPIAYITEHKEFYGLDFIVTPDVLIPRPDTELLVDTVIDYYSKNNALLRPMLVDIGTGSGNIAVAVKKTFSGPCTMLATDISAKAISIASCNAKKHKVAIKLFTGDVLKALPNSYLGKLDAIIFNAPYLSKTEARKKSLSYEPQVALTPPGGPTEIIERMLQQAPRYLKPRGTIFLEIGQRQGKQVSKLCNKYFSKTTITISKDLGNFDRVITCDVN